MLADQARAPSLSAPTPGTSARPRQPAQVIAAPTRKNEDGRGGVDLDRLVGVGADPLATRIRSSIASTERIAVALKMLITEPTERRHDEAQRLRQHHLPPDHPPRQRQRLGRLVLPLGHAQDAGADDLAAVGRDVEDQRQERAAERPRC